MKPVQVTAHFDGEHILLDEPLELEPDAKLIVTVLPGGDRERESWQRVAAEGLAAAYGSAEVEYSVADVKVSNPDYERK